MTSDKPVLDLGNVMEGQIVKGSFAIINDDNRDLNIIGANGSCGCTVPNIQRGLFRAGERREVDVSFNTTGRKGMNYKSIFVHFTDKGEQKSLVIPLNCNVQ